MEITKLPKEVQFCILSKLDGSSLLKAEKVCTVWSEIVVILETSFHVWMMCCLRDIPRRILVQLTGLPELLDENKDDYCKEQPWLFWKDVFLDYHRMSLIEVWIPEMKSVMKAKQMSFCTSLRLKDNIIVSGHTDGSVVIWQNEKEEQYKVLTKHRSHVTSVDLLNTVESIKNTDSWVNGYMVVSVSRDVAIHVSNPMSNVIRKIVHYSGPVHALSCWGSKFVVAADSSILNGQPIWKVTNTNSVHTDIVSTLYGHEETSVIAVAIWNNEVISGDIIGNLYKWTIPDSKDKPDKPIRLAKFSVSYTKSIYYDGYILICLLGDGSICWQVGDNKFKTIPNVEVLEVFSATPVCVACRARLLTIGLNSGNVLVYYFENDKSWENFNPAKPTCSIQICCDSINCIDIGDDGIGPVILISSTNEGIFRLQCRPP